MAYDFTCSFNPRIHSNVLSSGGVFGMQIVFIIHPDVFETDFVFLTTKDDELSLQFSRRLHSI